MNHIIRCENSGVFAGEIIERDGREVRIKNARRLWYWAGAASLSQLSQEGVGKPQECKFPQEVPEVLVLDAIEIIPMSDKAVASIAGVRPWQM
jgi:hypothetical protein